MGFEVVFKYHDKIENGYDTLENKTFKKKFGDPYEDVPLSKLALFIMNMKNIFKKVMQWTSMIFY